MSTNLRKTTTLSKVMRTLVPLVPLPPEVKTLTLTVHEEKGASARRFMKRILPRIAYSNPHLQIEVLGDQVGERAHITLTSTLGSTKRVDIGGKSPSLILSALEKASRTLSSPPKVASASEQSSTTEPSDVV